MTTSVGRYVVDVEQYPEKGKNWIVRVHRKSFPFKKLISSDWFLEENQAQEFAAEVSAQLGSDAASDKIQTRRPGWTLVRPAR